MKILPGVPFPHHAIFLTLLFTFCLPKALLSRDCQLCHLSLYSSSTLISSTQGLLYFLSVLSLPYGFFFYIEFLCPSQCKSVQSVYPLCHFVQGRERVHDEKGTFLHCFAFAKGRKGYECSTFVPFSFTYLSDNSFPQNEAKYTYIPKL